MADVNGADFNICPNELFDNLKALLRPEEVSDLLGLSVTTIYNWKYRAHEKGIPQGLFMKFNHRIYIRTQILKTWVSTQNPA